MVYGLAWKGAYWFNGRTCIIPGNHICRICCRKQIETFGEKFQLDGQVQFVAIVILVFTMGSRIGADKSIVASLDSIGITALIITVFILAGSVGAVFLARKLLGFNKEGVKTDD